MTHFELAVQISASKSKYYRELMRFKVLEFWPFHMKIEKALEFSCFQQIHGPTVKKHLSRDYVGLIGFDER
jgi:hypothetical protein